MQVGDRVMVLGFGIIGVIADLNEDRAKIDRGATIIEVEDIRELLAHLPYPRVANDSRKEG